MALDGQAQHLPKSNSALIEMAQLVLDDQVVLYDGLTERLRLAADVLIGARAVEVYETEDGLIYLRPLGVSVLNLLRGQIGEHSLLHRLASGRVPAGT